MAAKKKPSKSATSKRGRAKTDIVPTMLRMREDLRKRIEASARKNANSMNEEMVIRLEVSYIRDKIEARDTTIVELLTGQWLHSAELLRNFVLELQKRPRWHLSEDAKNELYDCLAFYIAREGLLGGSFGEYESYDDYRRRAKQKEVGEQ